MTRVTCALLLFAGTASAADLENVVYTVRVPDNLKRGQAAFPLGVPGKFGAFWGEIGGPPLGQPPGRYLTFVMPRVADKPLTVTTNMSETVQAGPRKGDLPVAFGFVEQPATHSVEVRYGNRPVLRYMNAPRDGTTKDTHELTFKPFHHVFDPVKGETLLTNGAGLAANKDLLYPHHRGLFFAFNKVSYDDQKNVDTWHGRNGEYTLHEKMLNTEAGEVYARHRAALSWHGKDGKPFADEQREVTVYNISGGTLLDWATQLTTTRAKVRLDGDPQHAGFHFRAAMEVAKNGKANTYYLRPDGKGKMGETRNWEPKTDKGPVDLPWDACSFVVGGQRYTVLRVNHPDNPKPARGSEREYGRFGDYFEYDLTPDKPLALKYRVWVQPGEMTVEQCEAIAKAFVSPPQVTVK